MIVHYEGKPCYKIIFETTFERLPEELKKMGYSEKTRLCIITDSNVAALFLQEAVHVLEKEFGKISYFVFHAGEEQKNLDTIQLIYEKLIEEQFDRKDLLIALGGGVTGDMCGFAASTYLRGIDFVQVPTTLLSQVDSSIGGKTGVDFKQYKNMVGAFYQPKLVYMNLSVLKHLPEEHFCGGMGEVLKHGLIKDQEYFRWLCEHHKEIRERKTEYLHEMIYRSCNIKRTVVENDPKEKGERALLNFGHTAGHAIEKLSDFKLIHGYCVALGIVAASFLSVRYGDLAEAEYQEIRHGLELFGLPCRISLPMSGEDILNASKKDKKMEAGKIKFILLNRIGNAYINKNVTDNEIQTAIQEIL